MLKGPAKKTFIFCAGILISSYLIFAAIAIPAIQNAAADQLRLGLAKQLSLVKDDFKSYLQWKISFSIIQSRVNEVAQLSKSRLTISKKDGTVIVDSAKGPLKDSVYITQPLKDNKGQILGYLRFAAPRSLLPNTTGIIMLGLLIAGAAALGLAFTLGQGFSLSGQKPEGHLTQLNLIGLIEEAVNSFSEKAWGKNLKLQTKFLTNTCYVIGCQQYMKHSIELLLERAIKQAPTGGKIEISCIPQNNNVELVVNNLRLGFGAV